MLPIALTAGEPAGIGPDIVIQIAQQSLPAPLVIIGDPALLISRAQQLQLPLRVHFYQAHKEILQEPGLITVLPINLAVPCRAGKLNPGNADYVLETLTRAAQGCLAGEFAAVVTGPVNKSVINATGNKFSGHTEFFADFCGIKRVVMMLMSNELRVALVTTHLPLRAVADAITSIVLHETLSIVQKDLQKYFGIAQPKMYVCGLNPHAGENGYLGDEEIRIIIPTLEELRQQGLQVIGPLSADTIFNKKYRQQADVFVAMYHDQGLPVLKYSGFHKAINITLGLPFLRTSVDHGTALELAGSGQANAESLLMAIQTAADCTQTLLKNDGRIQ